MAERTFEWDATKARANLAKHGVSFDEATAVFRDPLAQMHADPDHSGEESRSIMVGHGGAQRLLVVSFLYRSDRIRIISARAATRGERHRHEEST
jgi:uncharacterized DUF497 family protein